MKSVKLSITAVSALIILAVLLSSCASSNSQAASGTPQVTQLEPQTPSSNPGTPQAAQRARQNLANKLGDDPSKITIISVEGFDWPDTCLGIQLPDQMCAMHVVPGYKVILGAGQQTYEYHTDKDGSVLRTTMGMSYRWEEGAQCYDATVIPDQGITYGYCDSTPRTVPFFDGTEAADLTFFLSLYTPFTASTETGTVSFFGMGDQQATLAEQRMITEWTQQVVNEASGGRDNPAYGLVLSWHREDGLAGYCDDLSIYITGEVVADSCNGGHIQPLGRTYLDAAQLKQLTAWVTRLTTFELRNDDRATTDAVSVNLIFQGLGTTPPESADKSNLLGFAQDIYTQVNGSQSDTGVGTPVSAPEQIVSSFLTSYQQDPNGKHLLDYLVESLVDEVNQGHSISEILGIQNSFRSFGISNTGINQNTNTAVVKVGLNYVSPIRRDFILSMEDNDWRISTIISYAVPSMSVTDASLTGAETILRYIQALRSANLQTAWAIMTPKAQAEISMSVLETDAQAIESVNVNSIKLLSQSQDKMFYEVMLWVQPKQGQLGSWQDGENQRWFELFDTPEGWRINQVSATMIQ